MNKIRNKVFNIKPKNTFSAENCLEKLMGRIKSVSSGRVEKFAFVQYTPNIIYTIAKVFLKYKVLI